MEKSPTSSIIIKPLVSLKKTDWICAGSRGIASCGSDSIAILSGDGNCSMVSKDEKNSLKSVSLFKFPKTSEWSSILPNPSGSQYLLSDFSSAKVSLVETSSNKELKEWKLAQRAMKVEWVPGFQGFCSFGVRGKIQVFSLEECSKAFKEFSPFKGEPILDGRVLTKGKTNESGNESGKETGKLESSSQKEIPNGDSLNGIDMDNASKEKGDLVWWIPDMVFCGVEGRIARVSGNSGKVQWSQNISEEFLCSLAVANDERTILVGGDAESKRIWQISSESGETIGNFHEMNCISHTVLNISYSPCSQFLCVLTGKEIVMFSYERDSGKGKVLDEIKINAFKNSKFLQGFQVFWQEKFMLVGDGEGNIYRLTIE